VLHLEKQKQFEQKRGASWIVLLSCVFFLKKRIVLLSPATEKRKGI